MDSWFELILSAVKQREATPEERRTAMARAGAIAATYAFNEEATKEIFGITVPDRKDAQGLR